MNFFISCYFSFWIHRKYSLIAKHINWVFVFIKKILDYDFCQIFVIYCMRTFLNSPKTYILIAKVGKLSQIFIWFLIIFYIFTVYHIRNFCNTSKKYTLIVLDYDFCWIFVIPHNLLHLHFFIACELFEIQRKNIV